MNNTKISLLVVLAALFAALAPGCSQPGYRVIQKFVATTTAVTIGNDVLSFPRPLDMPPEAEKMYWLCVQDAKQNNECNP
jgi:hypothetical protein